MASPLVSFDQVCVTFSDNNVLDSVSFALYRNKITTLIGPNGAGKSTLVKTLLGLITPSSGQIIKAANLRIGYVPQKLHFNRALPLTVVRFLSLKTRFKHEQLLDVLRLVGGEKLLHSSMHTLSGGEMQRVLLANALLKKPDLLVLDEPVQGVDVSGQLALYALIATIKDSLGCAVLMVSHDLHLVMAKTDEVICLQHHICCKGAPEAISIHPEYLALFGKETSEQLALYQHHHNHKHDIAGQPIHHPHQGCNHD